MDTPDVSSSSSNNGVQSTSHMISLIKSISYRPSWDEYFIMTAYIISKRSTCSRLKVGCVLTKNNRIVATGYNGHIAGAAHCSILRDGHEMATIHAETNTISNAAKFGSCTEDCTVYVTHYPCLNCTKNLISSGVKCVIYVEDYNNDPIAIQLFAHGKIPVIKFTN